MRSYVKWPVSALLSLSIVVPVSAEDSVADPAAAVIEELLAAHRHPQPLKVAATVPSVKVDFVPTRIALADVEQKEVPADPQPPAAPATQPTTEPVSLEPAPAPAPVPAPPAAQPQAVVPPPAPVPQAELPPARDPLSPAPTVNDVLTELQNRHNANVQQAAGFYTQSAQALEDGDLAQAMRLAVKANRLAPGDQKIGELISQIRAENAQHRLATASHSKAKAHLASGLTRGQDLLAAKRYRDGEDLLKGVLEASDLFPADARIEIYRDHAKRELATLEAGVKSGKILLPPLADATEVPEEPILVAAGVSAPANLPRLLRGSESAVPLWYSTQKNLLARDMTVAYKNTPISLVLEDISEATGIRFVLDAPVVQSRGTVNGILNLRVAEIPAEKILDLACLKGGMEYVIMEKAVVVTTPTRALDYVRQLPRALRENWALGRVLFPSLNPELYADAPRTLDESELAAAQAEEESLPAYLTSGKALVEDIAGLLR